MLAHDSEFAQLKRWNPRTPIPTFHIVLSQEAARRAKKHVDIYLRKGLMKEVRGLKELSDQLSVSEAIVASTLEDYRNAARQKTRLDPFGKVVFENVPSTSWKTANFFVGEVTPVLHYCMGGVSINKFGQAINAQGRSIPGLYAVGEVTGGVHGNNRLGGNSLLECAVFGSIVGNRIPLSTTALMSAKVPTVESKIAIPGTAKRVFSIEELVDHSSQKDCYIALHGNVYDLTYFLEHHPGGKWSILTLCGTEASDVFAGVHSSNFISSLDNHFVGKMEEVVGHDVSRETPVLISLAELRRHSAANDCWVVLHGMVYDLTNFSLEHPGGAYLIQKLAGTDATMTYHVFHPKEKMQMANRYIVGRYQDTSPMNSA